MFTGNDLTIELRNYFISQGYSVSIFSYDEKSKIIDIADKLSLSFDITNERPPKINVTLDSPRLNNSYSEFISNLEDFYESNLKFAQPHYNQFAERIKNPKLKSLSDKFIWECTPSSENVSEVFESVFDACIRLALYIVMKPESR